MNPIQELNLTMFLNAQIELAQDQIEEQKKLIHEFYVAKVFGQSLESAIQTKSFYEGTESTLQKVKLYYNQLREGKY